MSEHEGLGEQRVTWAELFVDLVWVFAVTQVAVAVAGASGPGALARTVVILVPLWWGWVGVTLLGNAVGATFDDARGRLVVFALAACGLGMSLAVPEAYGNLGLMFAGSYLLLRLALWLALWWLSPSGGFELEPFTVSLFVVAPLFVAGGFLDGSWRWGLWAVAAAVEAGAPALLRHRLNRRHFEAAHLPERFGLFIIIVLGETVVAIGGAAAGHINAATVGTVAVGFVTIVALWWTYFHYVAPAVRYSLRTNPTQSRIVRTVFSYAHFLYVAGIIAVAVGLKKMVGHPLDLPHKPAEFLLAPGAAVYLLAFCYSRWRMFGAAGAPRFYAGVLAVVVAGLAPFVPQVVTAVLVMVVVAGLNGFELWIVESGRPSPLLHWPRRSRPAVTLKTE